VTVAVGLAKVKPFNPSQRMKNLTSRAITLARFDLSSLEYADDKGILYQREQKILASGYKRLANKPGSATTSSFAHCTKLEVSVVRAETGSGAR